MKGKIPFRGQRRRSPAPKEYEQPLGIMRCALCGSRIYLRESVRLWRGGKRMDKPEHIICPENL